MARMLAQPRGRRGSGGGLALRTAVLATALLAAPTPLHAGDVDQAKTLFDQGVSDLLAGRLERACPAIDRSYKLDPRPGTLFTLAECEAQRGHIATAHARYTEFLALYKQFTPKKRAEQKDRADASKAQIDTLTPQVPLVTVRLPEGVSADDAQVKHNGEVLPVLSLSAPLSCDPGDNVFTLQVPGGSPVEHHIDLKIGERRELVLALRREEPVAPTASVTASAAPSGAPSASGAGSASSAAALAPSAAPQDARGFRLGAIAVGSLGATGVVFGVMTGVLAVDRKRAVNTECHRVGSSDVCTPEGVSAGEQLKVLGAASTTALVIGTAGLAAAGILLLVMPSSRPARPPVVSVGVSATPGGVRVFGSF